MNSPNSQELFSAEQLDALRMHYGKVERIDPCSEVWLGMREFARSLPLAQAKQLAGANIKWLSDAAKRSLA